VAEAVILWVGLPRLVPTAPLELMPGLSLQHVARAVRENGRTKSPLIATTALLESSRLERATLDALSALQERTLLVWAHRRALHVLLEATTPAQVRQRARVALRDSIQPQLEPPRTPVLAAPSTLTVWVQPHRALRVPSVRLSGLAVRTKTLAFVSRANPNAAPAKLRLLSPNVDVAAACSTLIRFPHIYIGWIHMFIEKPTFCLQ
jgi:hypothetical protein